MEDNLKKNKKYGRRPGKKLEDDLQKNKKNKQRPNIQFKKNQP